MAPEKSRRRSEQAASAIDLGSEFSGPLVGGGIGLIGGPLGAIGGGLAGTAVQRGCKRLAAEFRSRRLGPRQKQRAGAALYFALEEIAARLEGGEELREDEFFEDDEVGQSRADQILEAVLDHASRDCEEKKVRHLGLMYAAFAFDSEIEPSDANFLVALGSDLTFSQLTVVALMHEAPYRSLPGWKKLHPHEWRAQILAEELFDMAKRGVVARTDNRPVRDVHDVDPSQMWISVLGCRLYHLMALDQIEEDSKAQLQESLDNASRLELPDQLVAAMYSAVDSEPLSEQDLGACQLRIRCGDRAASTLPAVGSRIPGHLPSGEATFIHLRSENDGEVAILALSSPDRELFQADLEFGRVVRIAPSGDGGLIIG
jgi:hypothetical protein